MEKTLGQMLGEAMRRKGITGIDLAERIGRSPSFVSELINDEKKVPPPPATLAAIERELGVSQVTMLAAWGYTVRPSEPPTPISPGKEAALYVIDQMDDEEAQALADTGTILMRIRHAKTLTNPRQERVPAIR